MKTGRITTHDLQGKKGSERIVMVTAYDAWTARLVDPVADVILVGDSLGVVIQGHTTTVPVTLDDMVYHTRCVLRGSRRALVVADLPFGSYQTSVEDALRAGGRCLKEGGAQAVKLEGGRPVVSRVRALVDAGIPVVAHVGVTPQSVHALGSLDAETGARLGADAVLADATALVDAGAFLVVMEGVPAEVAETVTGSVSVPTIGIGSGAACDGQVQIFHDLCGLGDSLAPAYRVTYADGGAALRQAVEAFADDVRRGRFPPAE
jgi:3-methyl-2-oxobutanoate hydroxymethyltransferase